MPKNSFNFTKIDGGWNPPATSPSPQPPLAPPPSIIPNTESLSKENIKSLKKDAERFRFLENSAIYVTSYARDCSGTDMVHAWSHLNSHNFLGDWVDEMIKKYQEANKDIPF